MNRLASLIAGLCAVVAVLGCASEGVRVDVREEAVLTQDFNPKDLQVIAEKGASKLVEQVRSSMGQGALKAGMVVFVADVQNRTDEHIDSAIIRSYLETELVRLTSVRLVDRGKAMEVAKKELAFQQGGLADPKTAQEIGKIVGADHLVYAELSNIRTKQRSGRKQGQFFYFSVALLKVDTGDKIPVNVQIQKRAKRGWFGW